MSPEEARGIIGYYGTLRAEMSICQQC